MKFSIDQSRLVTHFMKFTLIRTRQTRKLRAELIKLAVLIHRLCVVHTVTTVISVLSNIIHILYCLRTDSMGLCIA